MSSLKPNDRVHVRTYAAWASENTTPTEATIEWRNLERAWRTREEEALGREFTRDEPPSTTG